MSTDGPQCRITQFAIGVSHTVNLGNFESMRIEASMTWEVGQNVDQFEFDEIKLRAQQELKKICRETYLAQRKKKAPDLEEMEKSGVPY